MNTKNSNHQRLFAILIVLAVGGSRPPIAMSDEVDLHQVLQGPTRCDHVIEMMLRHGVNREKSDSYGSPMMYHGRMGPMWIPHKELGDLELVEVAQLPDTDPACGPTFVVGIRNTSNRDVCGFRVTMVSLLGRIFPTAPTTVVKVDKVCAGQVAEIHVQLPIESLAMGTRNGQAIEFSRLVVAIDSFDQFVECNEGNNVKVLDRASIAVREIVVESAEPIAPVDPAQTIVDPAATPGDAATQNGSAQQTAPPNAPPANEDLMSAINRLDDNP